MSKIPISQVTIIATGLGIFFLIVAFYKSIFHKRRPPTHAALNPKPDSSALQADQPITLTDPYRQVPVDTLPVSPPTGHKHTSPTQASFYPSLPKPEEPSVSAFRQFNPKKDFDVAATSPKNETTYEWE